MPMPAAKKYRVIIAHGGPEERRQISELLERSKLFQVIYATSDGIDCVKKAIRCQPELVITDTVLTGIDGLEVLYRLKATQEKTKVILLTSYQLFLNNRTASERADYTILAPYTGDLLVKRAMEMVMAPTHTFSLQAVAEETAALLADIGAPMRLKGYSVLFDGVQLVALEPGLIHRHGPDGLYAQLCSRHHESYRNVERCMRSLSQHIFTHTSLNVLENYFSKSDLGRSGVTNLTLIATLASHVRKRLKNKEVTSIREA